MAANNVGRADQYEITLWVAGIYIGVMDAAKGGALDSQEVKYRPGGMGEQVSLGGPRQMTNLTLTKGFDRNADAENVRWIMSQVGIGRCTVVKQPLDADKNAWGRPFVYTGLCKQFILMDVDSKTSDIDTYQVEISTDGTIS